MTPVSAPVCLFGSRAKASETPTPDAAMASAVHRALRPPVKETSPVLGSLPEEISEALSLLKKEQRELVTFLAERFAFTACTTLTEAWYFYTSSLLEETLSFLNALSTSLSAKSRKESASVSTCFKTSMVNSLITEVVINFLIPTLPSFVNLLCTRLLIEQTSFLTKEQKEAFDSSLIGFSTTPKMELILNHLDTFQKQIVELFRDVRSCCDEEPKERFEKQKDLFRKLLEACLFLRTLLLHPKGWPLLTFSPRSIPLETSSPLDIKSKQALAIQSVKDQNLRFSLYRAYYNTRHIPHLTKLMSDSSFGMTKDSLLNLDKAVTNAFTEYACSYAQLNSAYKATFTKLSPKEIIKTYDLAPFPHQALTSSESFRQALLLGLFYLKEQLDFLVRIFAINDELFIGPLREDPTIPRFVFFDPNCFHVLNLFNTIRQYHETPWDKARVLDSFDAAFQSSFDKALREHPALARSYSQFLDQAGNLIRSIFDNAQFLLDFYFPTFKRYTEGRIDHNDILTLKMMGATLQNSLITHLNDQSELLRKTLVQLVRATGYHIPNIEESKEAKAKRLQTEKLLTQLYDILLFLNERYQPLLIAYQLLAPLVEGSFADTELEAEIRNPFHIIFKEDFQKLLEWEFPISTLAAIEDWEEAYPFLSKTAAPYEEIDLSELAEELPSKEEEAPVAPTPPKAPKVKHETLPCAGAGAPPASAPVEEIEEPLERFHFPKGMKARKVVAMLLHAGIKLKRHTGSHHIFDEGLVVPLSTKTERRGIARGTMASIARVFEKAVKK